MTAKIQVRRDITGTGGTGWSSNPTLADGEIGFDKTLKQLKIGDGATAWSSLPWLGDALPYLTSAQTDFNHSDYRTQGRYLITTPHSFTNGPIAPEDIKSDDGSAVLFILKFDTSFLQILSTRGNSGTNPVRPSKSYIRRYDGTSYYGWEPLTTWGLSSTEGTNVDAYVLTVKSDAQFSGNATVAGNASVTGAFGVTGATTLLGNLNSGDAVGDRVIVQPSSSDSLPTIGFKHGVDTSVGIASANADTVSLVKSGTAKVQLSYGTNTIFTRMNIDLDPDGTGLNTNYITGAAAPVGATGLARLKDTTASSLVVMIFAGNNADPFIGSDGSSEWTITGWGTATTRVKPKAGGVWQTTKWVGTAVAFASSGGGAVSYDFARTATPFDDTNTNCITLDTSSATRIMCWLTQYFP